MKADENERLWWERRRERGWEERAMEGEFIPARRPLCVVKIHWLPPTLLSPSQPPNHTLIWRVAYETDERKTLIDKMPNSGPLGKNWGCYKRREKTALFLNLRKDTGFMPSQTESLISRILDSNKLDDNSALRGYPSFISHRNGLLHPGRPPKLSNSFSEMWLWSYSS